MVVGTGAGAVLENFLRGPSRAASQSWAGERDEWSGEHGAGKRPVFDVLSGDEHVCGCGCGPLGCGPWDEWSPPRRPARVRLMGPAKAIARRRPNHHDYHLSRQQQWTSGGRLAGRRAGRQL
jgi:hypothetical protein